MSRGLGKLQRALLRTLEAYNWAPACELTIATQPGGIEGFNGTHQVSVRRALHGLHRLGLVHLAHLGLRCYQSRIRAGEISLGAIDSRRPGTEVLAAWLPSKPGPKTFGNKPETLNPKRFEKSRLATLATLKRGNL